MAVYNTNNIDFTRDLLVDKICTTVGGIALYYENIQATSLSVQVTNTQIIISYQGDSEIVTYSNSTIQQVCLDINRLTFPVKAAALADIGVLASGDFLTVANSSIPGQFRIENRGTDNSVILRTKYISVRHKTASEISLLDPYQISSVYPWYPRITIGEFTVKKNNKFYHYSIPEYKAQTWSTSFGRPFKDVVSEIPTIISNTVIKVSRTPIFWNGENLIIYKGTTPLSTNNILDVDINNGLVYLSKSLPASQDISVSYVYKEETYEYKGINLNSHFSQNPTILGKYVVIYILPSNGSTVEPRKTTVSHIVGDSLSQTIDSIPTDRDFPNVIIGAYSVQQVANSNKVKVLDTRVLGGGLIDSDGIKNPLRLNESLFLQESDDPKIEDKYKEAGNFWDIGRWDGEIYPGSAAVVFDIPNEVRDNLPEDLIRKNATKFLAAGVTPLFDFTDRPLPDVETYSDQISCFITGSGSYFFSPSQYEIPDSLLDSDADPIIKDPPLSENGYLSPSSDTGVYQYYLKSSPIVVIEWEERSFRHNTNSESSPTVYSEWKKKRIYDKRQVADRTLVKGSVFFPSSAINKEYRNIVVHAPFKKSWNTIDYASYFDGIYSTISGYKQNSNNQYIENRVVNVDFDTELVSDYIGVHPVYEYLLTLMDSSISGNYIDGYNLVMQQLGSSIVEDKPFLLNYVVSTSTHVGFESTQTGLLLHNAIRNSARAIYISQQLNQLDETLLNTFTGLMYNIQGNIVSTDPKVGFDTFSYSPDLGYSPEALEIGESLGYSSNEIIDTFNPDHKVLNVVPTFYSLSPLLDSTTGDQAQSFASLFSYAKDFVDTEVALLTGAINNITYDNIPVLDTWYTRHDRIGQYIGGNLNSIVDAYEFLKTSTKTTENYLTLTGISGLDLDTLHSYFINIESILDAHHDTIRDLLYKGGMLHPDMDKVLYCYGWYVKNYETHYRLYNQIPVEDYRDRFVELYTNGLDILLKSMVTSEGFVVNTTIIDNNPGNFTGMVPSSIFNTMRIGMDIPGVSAKIAALYNTLSGRYFVDGVCYQDARKISSDVGLEVQISTELAKVYRDLNPKEDTYNYWDFIHNSLTGVRGLEFYPELTGNGSITRGNENQLGTWYFYNSGEIDNQISLLRDMGCNTIRLPLDYYYYSDSRETFLDSLSHLSNTCARNNIHIIPRFWTNRGSNFTDYGTYISDALSGSWKVPGDDYAIRSALEDNGFTSELEYYTDVTSTLEEHCSVLAYEVIDGFDSTESGKIEFITYAASGIKTLTDLPVIVSIANLNPLYTEIYNNEHIDYIGIPYSGIFKKNLSLNIAEAQNYTDKKLIVTKFSENIYDNTLDIIATMKSNNIGGIYGYAFDSITGSMMPGFSGRAIGYTDGTVKTSEYVSSLQSLATAQSSTYEHPTLAEYTGTNNNTHPSEFKDLISRDYIFSALKNWGRRSNIYPLYSGTLDMDEFKLQYNILNTVQSSLDQFNPTVYTYISDTLDILSTNQVNTLNNLRNGFDGNFLNGQAAWLSGSDYDWQRYGTYFTNWGNTLWAIIFNNRLNK